MTGEADHFAQTFDIKYEENASTRQNEKAKKPLKKQNNKTKTIKSMETCDYFHF